jgi:hypothetical protein
MLNITKETYAETQEITLEGVRWKQDADIEIETDCSGDGLVVTLALHRTQGDGMLLGRIELDDCLPEECLPEATIRSDFMSWWRQDGHGPEDFYKGITAIRIAKAARIHFKYQSLSAGVLVILRCGSHETTAVLQPTEAQKYFLWQAHEQ